MNITFSKAEEIYDRLSKPAPDPAGINAFAVALQTSKEKYGLGERVVDLPEFEYRPLFSLSSPHAAFPAPIRGAQLIFHRDGNNFFGIVGLSFDEKAPFNGFSDKLAKASDSRYRWFPINEEGEGYFYFGDVEESNLPVIAVNGGRSKKAISRSIWLGASGTRNLTLEGVNRFGDNLITLACITNQYVNTYLNNFAKSNPKDLTVLLSCF